MERKEVSLHQVKVYEFVREHGGWVTSHEIARGAGIAARTARAYALGLVKLGLFDQAQVFPGHRYRASEFADKRNRAYVRRPAQASEIFRPAV